jgi:glycosyltransferase involved in cell wall biosynthesis
MVHSDWDPSRSLKNQLAFFGVKYVLAVSDAVGRSLKQAGVPSNRLHTHYLGLIDPPTYSVKDRIKIRAELGIPQDAIVFGNIAFDSPVKGVDLLVEAFREVSSLRPDIRLLQLGIDSASSELSRSAKNLPNIYWLGIHDDACSYLSAVDVYVQPSRSEGIGLAIMEALAMERPVIASSVGGIPEIIMDGLTGTLVPPGCVRSLAQAMLRFVDDRAAPKWQNMAANALQLIRENFDGARSARVLIENYYES